MATATRRDQVGETRQLIEGTRVAYTSLSDPDQLTPSTMPRRDQASGAPKRKGAASQAPVDLNVLDWLVHAESVIGQVAHEVLGAAGHYADPNPFTERRWRVTKAGETQLPGDLVYPRRPKPGSTVPEALDAISDALDRAPDELTSETAARMWDLARGGAKLLGTDSPGLVRWHCPACSRKSVMVRPGSPDETVCVSRSCRKTFPLAQVANPSQLVA